MTSSDADVDWHELPADPATDDLGYEMLNLDMTQSSGDDGHYVILPHDEEFLRKEAFIVAGEDAVCDLLEHI